MSPPFYRSKVGGIAITHADMLGRNAARRDGEGDGAGMAGDGLINDTADKGLTLVGLVSH